MLDALDKVGRRGRSWPTARRSARSATAGLIGHDSDADLGYVSDHDHPVDVIRESFRIQRALTDMGYRVTRYSAIALKVHVEESDGLDRGLDVFGGFMRDGKLYLMGEIAVPFERSWIYPLGTATLEGREFPVPADKDRFLTATYGPRWRTPDPAYKFTTPASTIELLQRLVPGDAHGPRRLARLPQAHDRPLPLGLRRRARGGRAPPRPGDVRRHRVRPRHGRGVVRRPGHRRGGAGLPALRLRARGRAPCGRPDVSFQLFNLLELRHVLAVSAWVARMPGPRAVGCVHVVERLGHRGRLNMLRAARMMVAGTSGTLHLQFLSEKGRDSYARRTGARKPLAPEVVLAEVAESGGRVLELVREHVSDDPESSQVCRMTIDWNRPCLRETHMFGRRTTQVPGGDLAARVTALEEAVQENRALNVRLAELTDVVTELLLPVAARDEQKLEALLEKYRGDFS